MNKTYEEMTDQELQAEFINCEQWIRKFDGPNSELKEQVMRWKVIRAELNQEMNRRGIAQNT